MYVHEQKRPAVTPIPGVAHATWAGGPTGCRELSVWRQTLAPGAATPPHSHDCEEVVLCTAGCGELHIDGEVHRFGADSVITIPRGVLHQLFNVGPQPLESLAAFAGTPVGVFLPDGSALDLPWPT
jgi:quercetin dioxygenase-like cupin family protein